MTGKKVDLHLHSNHSDGVWSPAEVVRRAAQAELAAIALTDHDTVSGVEEALSEGRKVGIDVVSGIEISCLGDGYEVHMLGLFVDPTDSGLLNYSRWYHEERLNRARRILQRLAELGMPLDQDALFAEVGDGSLGRPHIAEFLVRHGYVQSFEEAFDLYLGDGKPAYVPKRKLHPREAIRLVHNAGGLAIAAHPGMDLTDQNLVDLLRLGLDGVETIHPKHTPEQVAHYQEFAQKHRLLVSGGSDCHGRGDEILLGTLDVPYRVFLELKEAHDRLRVGAGAVTREG